MRWGALRCLCCTAFQLAGKLAPNPFDIAVLGPPAPNTHHTLRSPVHSLPACCRELQSKFVGKVQEFMGALADAHRTAHSERSDTREELESLLNLMSRLDFNG